HDAGISHEWRYHSHLSWFPASVDRTRLGSRRVNKVDYQYPCLGSGGERFFHADCVSNSKPASRSRNDCSSEGHGSVYRIECEIHLHESAPWSDGPHWI